MDKYDKYDALVQAEIALSIRFEELQKMKESHKVFVKMTEKCETSLGVIREMIESERGELWPTK